MTRSTCPRPVDTGAESPPIRWWPVWVILLAATVAVIWVRLATETNQQERTLATAGTVLSTGVALLLWCLLFSRLRWRSRLAVLACVLGPVLAGIALLNIRGVTGDLLPVLEWRWRSSPPDLRVGSRTGSPDMASRPDSAPRGSADYPQFLGPHRDAVLTNFSLARDWAAQPPTQLWRRPVGPAWSGFAVAGHRAITQEQRGDDERVVCYDLQTGEPLWAHADRAHYQTTIAGEGPRATPTIAGDRVFTLGATGLLNCLDLRTGRAIWTKDIVADNSGRVNEWGISCSPLVFDDLVVVTAGGRPGRSLVAYRTATGAFVWGGGDEGAGYSSPRLATLGGRRQILIFTPSSLTAHDPADGRVLWSHPWPRGNPHVAMPVVLPGDRVLVSSGYGVGSELVQVKREVDGRFAATRLWKSIRLKAKFTNVICRDGFVYGLDDGVMVCLEAATGDLKWKEGRYGHGQEILVNDLLLVTTEGGAVVLFEPTPAGPRELARLSVFAGKTWNPPALAGPFLLVRNDLEAACYRLPMANPAPLRLTERPARARP